MQIHKPTLDIVGVCHLGVAKDLPPSPKFEKKNNELPTLPHFGHIISKKIERAKAPPTGLEYLHKDLHNPSLAWEEGRGCSLCPKTLDAAPGEKDQ